MPGFLIPNFSPPDGVVKFENRDFVHFFFYSDFWPFFFGLAMSIFAKKICASIFARKMEFLKNLVNACEAFLQEMKLSDWNTFIV